MSPRASFVLPATPIRLGPTLIEASAGTGKTFTIAGLFLRLILERDLSAREILVVTYTEAATEELRDRIRQTLVAAAAALGTGQSDHPGLLEILASHQPDAAILRPRLQRAIRGFDEAPIFTIHGFCQRTLKDRAFECGVLFDMELLVDESGLLQEVADDYWRTHFYETDRVTVCSAQRHRLTPERFVRWLELARQQPGLRILSRVLGRPLPGLIADLRQAFAGAHQIWREHEPAIRRLLAPGRKWAIQDHAKPDIMQSVLVDVAAGFTADGLTPETLEALHFLARSAMETATAKRGVTPEHPFFDQCEELRRGEADVMAGLRIDFLAQARMELDRRKQRRKQQSFDDLLLRLDAALSAGSGAQLAREVRRRYRAALIDEFQDTDPVQCRIFRTLFAPAPGALAAGEAPPTLCLIGDPKQAIYAFRGADLFTYLDAARAAGPSYTLEKNWRSEAGLVRAANTLFSRVERSFVFDAIQFQPVQAAGEADQEPLLEDDRSLPPLQVWFLPREPGAAHITQERAESIIPQVVAGEIVRLLTDPIRLKDRAVVPQDIAILVPTRRQARLMQEALQHVHVPSVLHVDESVFASREARELRCVLASIVQPSQERLLRAQLVTALMGCNAEQLHALAADARQWPERMERSFRYRESWQRRGFPAMFREWIQAEEVRSRLLGLPDGERRLTNLLHLGELLHEAAHDRQLGPAALVRWLGEQTARSSQSNEAHQLRLERDDQAVRIVTIHKSKGLEYAIVFCPFSWRAADIKEDKEEQVLCHREISTPEGPKSEFIWDLDSPDHARHRLQAIKEKLAEQVRLLYVALTRARNRCYFVWGAFHHAGSSAAAWLLHRPLFLADDLKAALDQHFALLSDDAILADLRALSAASRDEAGVPSIQVIPIPKATGRLYRPPAGPATTLAPRPFHGRIPRDWRMLSFSQLVARNEDERPDYDGGTAPDAPVGEAPEDVPAAGFFAFPRGARPGTCLHKIFEKIEFTEANGSALEPLVRAELEAHGLAPAWTEIVSAAVQRTLQMPLDQSVPGLTLASIPRRSRLSELEFQFPTQRLTPALFRAGLGHVAAAPGFAQQLPRLGFHPAGGHLKGYIDLVFEFGGRFYLVDWKSNWLGQRVEDYAQPRLEREMTERFYVLQYHLYTVALHRYLQRRLPGYDYSAQFGGVFYLFLRGLDPAQPSFGIFRDRPPQHQIQALANALTGPGAASSDAASFQETP